VTNVTFVTQIPGYSSSKSSARLPSKYVTFITNVTGRNKNMYVVLKNRRPKSLKPWHSEPLEKYLHRPPSNLDFEFVAVFKTLEDAGRYMGDKVNDRIHNTRN